MLCVRYIPDGMSAAQWEAVKKKEADAKKKNLGNAGARGFKSRSMQSFVAALEKGEADHLFAVDPREVRKGKIPLKDATRPRLIHFTLSLSLSLSLASSPARV